MVGGGIEEIWFDGIECVVGVDVDLFVIVIDDIVQGYYQFVLWVFDFYVGDYGQVVDVVQGGFLYVFLEVLGGAGQVGIEGQVYGL